MKTLLALLATTFAGTLAFASSQPVYTFTASDSFRDSAGACTQSALQVVQTGETLIVASSSASANVLKLSARQMSKFRKLANRSWGQDVVVVIRDGDRTLKFDGGSCGHQLCDSLEIREASGQVTTYEQPIHGLIKIDCP